MSDRLSPSQRSLRARLAAHTLHSRHDSREVTAPARAAFDQRFYDEVDPERVLPPKERERRAAQARSAHFTRMSLKSSQARARQVSLEAPPSAAGVEAGQARRPQGKGGLR